MAKTTKKPTGIIPSDADATEATEVVVPVAVVTGPFEALDHEQVVATDSGARELFAVIDGVRYEHVGDDADGRWIYRKS